MRTLLSIVVLLLLAGCATLQTAGDNVLFQHSVQYAVLKYIDGNPDKQDAAREAIVEVRHYADQETQVTVQDLKQAALDRLPLDRLDLADRFIVLALVADISSHLQDKVGAGVLDEDQMVALDEFLSWIEQAIDFAGESQ